ncbi:MAG TPA: hypothetical protein VHE61_01200 [Opitutaceae bacterium]|nr:hypothetical protein [Opitutaceae bacterium]
MKTIITGRTRFEFAFPERDTLVEVQSEEGHAVIRATRDTFTDEQKRRFVRMLAAEGFIPPWYDWASTKFGPSPIEWQIDPSWLEITEAVRAPARRFMLWLLVSAGVLWVGLMAALVAGRAN